MAPRLGISMPAGFGELRSATTSNGLALTATTTAIPFLKGTCYAKITPRNFSTAVVARVALSPWLTVLRTTDDLATAGNLTDASNAIQDGDTGTTLVLDSQDVAANGDYLYVGSHIQFGGVVVDVTAAKVNGTVSTLTVNYWDGSAWSDISDVDGTASGSASMAQDGNVTWTVPTDWTQATLEGIDSPRVGTIADDLKRLNLYWTRWEFSVALDSEVEVDEMTALSRSSVYWEIANGQADEFFINQGIGGVGGIEALTDDGTANLIVNVACSQNGKFG